MRLLPRGSARKALSLVMASALAGGTYAYVHSAQRREMLSTTASQALSWPDGSTVLSAPQSLLDVLPFIACDWSDSPCPTPSTHVVAVPLTVEAEPGLVLLDLLAAAPAVTDSLEQDARTLTWSGSLDGLPTTIRIRRTSVWKVSVLARPGGPSVDD